MPNCASGTMEAPSGWMTARRPVAAVCVLMAAPLLLGQSSAEMRRDPAPWTLEYCALRGKTDVAKMLLALGADPNKPGAGGVTPLHLAAMKDHAGVVEALLAHGAKVNVRDDAGQTPLHEAALGGSAKAAEILLAHGAEIDAKDRESGATPLYYAATWGRVAVTQLLLQKGAAVNVADAKGVGILRATEQNGQSEAAALLRKYGAVE
ncbi:MAG: ankyrin repeat domain-containing protein [Bryobacteraceae bacterium]